MKPRLWNNAQRQPKGKKFHVQIIVLGLLALSSLVWMSLLVLLLSSSSPMGSMDQSRLLLGLRGTGTGVGGGSSSMNNNNIPTKPEESDPHMINVVGESRSSKSLLLQQPPIAAANVSVPLHAESGSHHVHIYIGSPPQRQILIVDTGSRVMAFPCRPCQGCGHHASPYFDSSLSTTYKASKCGNCLLQGISTCSLYGGTTCEITQKYTEGSSWNADEVEDMVWLGTSNVLESVEDHMQLAVPYSFGCQRSVNGLFKEQYGDGILGLARHESSIIAAYHQAGAVARNAFSLCLTPDGGSLSLGGSLPAKYHLEQPMRMTPITREHGWYSVGVEQLMVGDIVVASPTKGLKLLHAINAGKGCILDNGTTDTYFPKAIAKELGKAAKDWTDGLTDFSETKRKLMLSYQQFQTLPDITLVLTNNVNLSLSPKFYMEGVTFVEERSGVVMMPWEGKKLFTNRVYLDETEGAVLGSNAMFGYDILFDVQDHRVGIAKADCAASAKAQATS